MKTLELSAALNSANVVENLKNFVGVDAQGAAALMTPERLAAVAGEKLGLMTENNKSMKENDSFELRANYGILIISTGSTGEMQVYALYGSNTVQKIGGSGNSFKIEKPTEQSVRITSISKSDIYIAYTFIGRLY